METREGVLQWLLEEDNPPVRYLALINLLNRAPSDPEVLSAQGHLMDYHVTQAILEHGDKFWNADEKSYWKYTGKYWQLIFLGQFLADGRYPDIVEGATSIFARLDQIASKGWLCLAANLLASLIRLGYENQLAVLEMIEVVANRVLKDHGVKCSGMDYSLLTYCHMALPKLLLCFGEVPREKRSPSVEAAIKLIVDALLNREVYFYIPGHRKEWQAILKKAPKREQLPAGTTVKGWIAEQRVSFLSSSGVGKREAKAGWLKFGFPQNYNSNVLEAMVALAKVGVPISEKLLKPLQVIQGKMTPEGRWNLETTLNGKMWVDVEEKGKPSKWITYFALTVLQHFDSC
jgi:hypothetical protein